jgi:hypothetical protein
MGESNYSEEANSSHGSNSQGLGAMRAGGEDKLSESIMMWSNIDSEVLLLVFLPGLIFRDALNVDFHLVSNVDGLLLVYESIACFCCS